MRIVHLHGMTRAAARAKLEAVAPRLVEQFGASVKGLDYRWSGDILRFSFHAVGADLKGELSVGERELALDVPLPLGLRLLEGMIRTGVETRLHEEFGPSAR